MGPRLTPLVVCTSLLFASCTSGGADESPTPDASPTPTVIPEPTPEPTLFVPDWKEHIDGLMSFWEKANIDTTNGGYFTNVNRTGMVGNNRDKWTRCVSREVYGFTRAFMLTGDANWLERAKGGVDWLLLMAHDPVHGGFFQKLSATGDVLADERTLFDYAYALNGLAAYFEATHDPEVGEVLAESYAQLEAVAWDPNYGGYFNVLTSDMSGVQDNRKSFNALVDTASAWLLTYYAATGDAVVKDKLNAIATNMVAHLIDPTYPDGTKSEGWIGEMFDAEWNYLPDEVPYGDDRTICGHNLKTVWVLGRIHALTGSSLYLSYADELLELTLDTCRDKSLGGIYDQLVRSTSTVIGYDSRPENADQKPWWQQEQGIFAAQLMEQLAGKSYYGKIHDETLQFYLRHFPDTEYGEVYATVYGDGRPKDVTKGNDSKSAYHSTETAWYSHLYTAFFTTKTDVVLYYSFEPATSDRTVKLAPVEVPYGTYKVVDPATLDGQSFSLDTPSTVLIPAGTGGVLKVTYRPQ